jgi:hypothetical protein
MTSCDIEPSVSHTQNQWQTPRSISYSVSCLYFLYSFFHVNFKLFETLCCKNACLQFKVCLTLFMICPQNQIRWTGSDPASAVPLFADPVLDCPLASRSGIANALSYRCGLKSSDSDRLKSLWIIKRFYLTGGAPLGVCFTFVEPDPQHNIQPGSQLRQHIKVIEERTATGPKKPNLYNLSSHVCGGPAMQIRIVKCRKRDRQ